MNKLDLKGVTLNELKGFVVSLQQPEFRASQILSWLYNKRIRNRTETLDKMDNISSKAIEQLRPLTAITSLSFSRRENLKNGAVFFFQTSDGHTVKTVLNGDTLFLSSQVGSNYICKLYPSEGPFERNLSTGEIVDQVIKVQKLVCPDIEIKKISIDGIGEPLDNYWAVTKAIKIINGKWGLGYYMRNICLSTCGVVPEMVRLVDNRVPVQLSVKLHSVNEQMRSFMMPVNERFPLDTVFDVIKYYGRKSGRTVFLEYTLIEGMNDSVADAKLLAKKLVGLPVVVNIIPYPYIQGSSFIQADTDKQEQFLGMLIAGNVKAFISFSSGFNIPQNYAVYS